MLVSYNWLQTFFATPLPSPEEIAEKLTFHSSEIEEVKVVGEDTVIDVKVLPDKSAWLLSHRGIAKELSVILNIPLQADSLKVDLEDIKNSSLISVSLNTSTCDFYSATLVSGVKVGPSPVWLKERLEAVGQKSINNIVDITNYVMLETGQPLHAFDAETLKLNDGTYSVGVRQAVAGEKFVSLTKEEYTLTTEDAVIIDGQDEVLALAGVKGGLNSGITEATTSIILEAAHFDRVAVRKTANRHRILTDASKRYENGVSVAIAPKAVVMATKMFKDLTGGEVTAMTTSGHYEVSRRPVRVELAKINSVLGVDLDVESVSDILKRFGYHYEVSGSDFTVTPDFERDDINIPADLVEEIGRMYGLDKIIAKKPALVKGVAINKRHYYADVIRGILEDLGFSEVYTSSFRDSDIVRLQNALASDKGYLRSSLAKNISEALERNLPYRDLLGIKAVQVFEIGTVFDRETEEFMVALAVQTNTSYKPKVDDELWQNAIASLKATLGVELDYKVASPGVITFSLDQLLLQLPDPQTYHHQAKLTETVYKTPSIYPPVSRDVALWVGEGAGVEVVEEFITNSVPKELLARLTHLDTFSKDGRTSLAFRLVFLSKEKTLDGSEVDVLMSTIYDAIAKAGFEVR